MPTHVPLRHLARRNIGRLAAPSDDPRGSDHAFGWRWPQQADLTKTHACGVAAQ